MQDYATGITEALGPMQELPTEGRILSGTIINFIFDHFDETTAGRNLDRVCRYCLHNAAH